MYSTTMSRIIVAAIGLFSAAAGLAAGDGPQPPALPKIFLETGVAATPVSGKTIEVGPGGDFQAALDKAQPGDEVVLQAGAAYTGNFILPAKQGSGKWITIRTSNMTGLPQEGTRVGPRHAAAMPKIVDPNGSGAINTALRAGYYRLIGLDVTLSPKAKLVWALVNLGNGGKEQNSLDLVAHHLILDRMYIHGDPKHDCFRCVALNSASSAMIDSYLSEGHANGFDAQAICCNNSPGPLKIVNNYLEGGRERHVRRRRSGNPRPGAQRHRVPLELLLQAPVVEDRPPQLRGHPLGGEEPLRTEERPAGADRGQPLRK